MDRDFEFIHESLPEEENVNTTTTNKHVPDIERNNRIIKKRARLPISTFPFKNIPVWMIVELLWFVGIWLNQEPSDNGVLDLYFPLNIIMGQDIDYDKHCKFRFSSYVEAHEDRKISKDME